jgi:hypothetical protein
MESLLPPRFPHTLVQASGQGSIQVNMNRWNNWVEVEQVGFAFYTFRVRLIIREEWENNE